MILLLDQNLSRRLIATLASQFPGTRHVQDFGLERADDGQVWEHAKASGLTIVTKDVDFHERSILYGHPPKVIWIRLGNCTTASVEMLLRNSLDTVLRFGDGLDTCLVLGKR